MSIGGPHEVLPSHGGWRAVSVVASITAAACSALIGFDEHGDAQCHVKRARDPTFRGLQD